MLTQLEAERRAVRLRVGGEERWIAADDAGLYRDAFGAVAPSGLPEAFMADVEAPLEKLVARYARTHGPFTTGELRDRYLVDPTSALTALERAGELVRGELRPSGSEREWCDPEVLRRLRRASLAVLRKEIEAADQRALAAFLPSWQGVDRHPAGGAGVDRLREVLVPLQGLALPADVWERDVLPRRCGAYSPTWLDQLCASGEVVWVGAGALGRNSGRVALYFRDDVEAIGPPPNKSERPDTPEHDLLRERLAQAPCFFTDLLAELPISPEQIQEALWDLVWAGEVTNDAWAPLRAPRLTLARAQRARDRDAARPALRLAPRRRAGAGPGPLVADHLALPRARSSRAPAGARWPSCCSSATASSPASRCWPRGSPAASRSSTTPSASSRRSACAGAATSSRASAARSSRCPARSSACARSAPTRRRRRSCWRPPTRRSPTARRCRGPSATRRRGARSAWPAPTSSSPAPSPCSTSSAAARASPCSSSADDARIAPGARGAGALRHLRARAQALARARRRRAGRRLALGGAAHRARLPRRAAQAHAERMIARLDHVQVAAPAGGEEAARAFYGDLLGLPELPKPERLRARGGVWFAVGEQQLHVGIEESFAPARKAHPALAVPRAGDLSALAAKLEAAGRAITWDGPRFYVEDPFGNRLELLAPHAELRVRALRDDERAWAARGPGRELGRVVIGGGREHRPAELPALVAEADGERAGLATYLIEDADCELVTLDALTVGGGIGGALVEAVADDRPRGRLHAPAPDHHQRQPPRAAPLPAPRLRARRGAPGRGRRPRRRKPQIPATGHAGIPIRDELVLERRL